MNYLQFSWNLRADIWIIRYVQSAVIVMMSSYNTF